MNTFEPPPAQAVETSTG